MGYVRAREVVAVHLLLVGGEFGFDEEAWAAGAGAAPDDVGRLVVVPCCSFGEDAGGFRRGGEVGADIVEALGGAEGCFLCEDLDMVREGE